MESLGAELYKQRSYGVDTISHRAYMLGICGFTILNIIVAGFASSISYFWNINNGWLMLLFILACTVVSIGGAVLAHSNDDVTTSIVGGFVCAGAMGLMCGPFIALYTTGSVMQAFALSVGVVFLTGMIGAILPQDLSGWGTPLFGLLLGAILLQVGILILGSVGFNVDFSLTLLDVAVVLLFSFIMVYDLNMAQRLDRTLNNAVDVAVNVFLNFANIFIRILSLMGDND